MRIANIFLSVVLQRVVNESENENEMMRARAQWMRTRHEENDGKEADESEAMHDEDGLWTEWSRCDAARLAGLADRATALEAHPGRQRRRRSGGSSADGLAERVRRLLLLGGEDG